VSSSALEGEAWPDSAEGLVERQRRLAVAAVEATRAKPWSWKDGLLVAGCFVTFAPSSGDGDAAWAAAIAWRPNLNEADTAGGRLRRIDQLLRGSSGPIRRARDVVAQVVVSGATAASYVPGLLALRHGPLLAEAMARLPVVPDVVLVDGTGRDHPRRAGLAVHLGAVLELPTVGVTNRALLATGTLPAPVPGARTPAMLDDEVVGFWVTTAPGARPVLAHAAWRTSPDTAATVVLATSTEAARTPVPIQEARRVAREARAERL
jgi:deoxyribonuclease V